MTEICGIGNPDAPGAYSCEYPLGHDRIWRYGAWQDHGAPSARVWWVVPPFTEEEDALIALVAERIDVNPHFEELLTQELAAHGIGLERIRPRAGGPATDPFTPRFSPDDVDTTEMAAITHGTHAAPPDAYPEYSRARGYTILPPGTPM